MWILPSKFQYRPSRHRNASNEDGDEEDESEMFDSSYSSGISVENKKSIRSPQPPERGNQKLSPNARRKKRALGAETVEDPVIHAESSPPQQQRSAKRKTSTMILSEKREMARKIPDLLLQIKNSLTARASSLKQAFIMLDTDTNNVVNRHEFKAWLRKYGLVKLPKNEVSDRLMDMVFERMDVDRDGQISFAEFATKLSKVKTDPY